MKALKHAQSSQKIYKGKLEDYLPLHNFFDSSKDFFPDIRHRALRHHAEGIGLAVKVFGDYITNSDGKLVSVRALGEQHVLEDLGFIPTLESYFKHITPQRWMFGLRRKRDPDLRKSTIYNVFNQFKNEENK